MSVQVEISIAGGSAYRWLEIELQTMPQLDENGHRDPEEIGYYLVKAGIEPTRRHRRQAAAFAHRYGDDVLELIAKAGNALREQNGMI